jgi:hypothetical protein
VHIGRVATRTSHATIAVVGLVHVISRELLELGGGGRLVVGVHVRGVVVVHRVCLGR